MSYQEFSGELDKPTGFTEFTGQLDSEKADNSAPQDLAQVDYSDAATAMQGTPPPAPSEGLIQRVGRALRPESRSVMQDFVPTPAQTQEGLNRRLSYGAGPISSQTAATADAVRSSRGRADRVVSKDSTVNKVVEGMDRQGTTSLGDLTRIAQNETNVQAARDSKAAEFRTAGEWAVDTLSNVSQGVVGLVQLPINIIAPSSEIAQTLRDTQKELQAQESDVLKAQRDQLRERVRNEDGFFDKYAATVVQLVTSPALSLAEAARQVPNFLGVVGAARAVGAASAGAVGLAGRASPTVALGEAISGGALQAGARAVGTKAGGAGASMVMAGGDAAGGVYEKLTDLKQTPLSVWQQNPDYQRLTAEGKSSEQAIQEIATAKARMAALVTAPLGLLGFAGAEAAVASRGLGKATADALTFAGAGKMLAKESIGEQLEEGGTQAGGNLIARTVDPSQKISEGVPEAMATALVTSAPFAALGARSQYLDARAAVDAANGLPPRVVSFTEPGSATDQAGLSPIVVPVPSGEIDVGTTGVPGSATAGGGQPSGDFTVPGLGDAGLGGVGAGGGGGTSAAGLVAVGGEAAPVGGAGTQQPAGLTRPFERATDADLLARTEASIAGQQSNNAVVQPTEQWFGRKGDGYATEADAQQALPGRQRMFKDLDWKVEPMPNGKFRLAGYSQETDLGTQTSQAQQAEAQGQQAAAGLVPGAASQPAAGAIQAELPAVQAAGVSAGPLKLDEPTRSSLKLAPQAPMSTVAAINNVLNKDESGQPLPADQQIQFNVISTKDLTDQHRIASAVMRMLGKTYTVVQEDSGKTLANGYAQLGGKHVLVAQDSNDAPLFVAVHEGYHSLPKQQRKALNTALLGLFRNELKGEFLTEFNYTEDQFDEEAPAFMAQVISKRADFWEDLRTKMGNKEFGEVAKVIIGKLSQIITGARQEYGSEFADKYITDIVKARDLLSTAYAEAMQAQGMTADLDVDVMASNRAGQKNEAASRIGDVSADRFKRTPALQQALQDLQDGRITRAEYSKVVDETRPVYPYKELPEITTEERARYALANGRGQSPEKAAKYGLPTRELQSGEMVQLRLDIPSYQEHDAWVVTVHRPKSTNRSVQAAYDAGPTVGYESAASITNATFGMRQSSAMKIAQGTSKGTIATVLGEWKPITPAEAKTKAQAAMKSKEWTQVGMDPFRHSYFYDRDTMRPVVSADEVIQIGPLVLAKNAQFDDENDVTGAPLMFSNRAAGTVTKDEAIVDGVMFSNRQRDLEDVPTIELKDLVDKKVFGIKADLMDAGRSYTGIDGSQLMFPIEMMGGPNYPRLKTSQKQRTVWAVRGGAVLSKFMEKVTKSDYVLVLAMNDNSHLTNSTATEAYIKTVEAYLRDGRISRENLLALDEIVRSPKNKSGLPDFPGFESPNIIEYIDGLSFDQRGALAQILEKKEAQAHGLPNLDRFRRETIDPDYAGYRQGDAMLVLEIDKDDPMVKLGENGTKLHPAYPLALRGRVVGKLAKGINYETIFRDYFDFAVPNFKNKEAGAWYGFDRVIPIQKITQRIADSVAPGGYKAIKTARQAEAALNFANNNWLVSGKTKAEGGISVQEFVDALRANDGAAALTMYTADEVKAGIKDQSFSIYQLGKEGGNKGLQVFFGLKRGAPWYKGMIDGVTDNEVEVVSVTNNESGAPGVGIPAIITKAISEGATILDAFAVKSKRFPDGFLPEMYAQFGFEEIGRIPFDESYYDANALADLKAFWSRGGWSEADGYPDVVVMRWRGKDEDRAEAVERYVRTGETGVSVGSSRFNGSPTADAHGQRNKSRAGKARAGGGDAGQARGNQGDGDAASVVRRAYDGIQELAALGDGDIRNLGLNPSEVQRLRDGLGGIQRSNRLAEPARGPGARPDAGDGSSVTGIHYGKAPGLSRLTGASFGSGIRGAEQARLAEPGVDPRIKRRVYFYLTNNNADTPRPEIGLGNHVYRATLGNMYDPTAATSEAVARVRGAMQGSGANAFETAVLDAGFRGYVNREQGTAVVLNSDVPVVYEGLARADQMRDRVIERVRQAPATRTEGDELVRKPTNDEMPAVIRAMRALGQAAPSFKLEYGEARVKQTEADAADEALAAAGAAFRFGAQPEDANSPFAVMSSNRVRMAPIEEPGQFDAKPGGSITVVRLANMQGLDNANAASVKGLYTYLSMVDDYDSPAGSEASGSDTIFVYKVKVPEAGFGEFSRARRGVLLDGEGVGRMKAKYGGYWYSFPQGTEADLIGSIPLTVVRDTAKSAKGSDNFDYLGTVSGSEAIGQAFKDAGFDFDEGGVMFSNRVTSLEDDLQRQQVFLQQRAEDAGYSDIEDFVANDYEGFVSAAKDWRDGNAVEVMRSNRISPADRIKWRKISDVKTEIGLDALPRHIIPFANFMRTMSDKATNGDLTARDLIKAYTIARSSMNRGAISTAKARDAGLKLPANFADEKIRPEGAFGYWLLSDVGQQYLNAAEVRDIDADAIANAVEVMAPFGTQNALGKDLERAASGDLHNRLPAMAAAIMKAAKGKNAVRDWQDATDNLFGVREAKKGFLGSLLGFGQLPTFDARQINVNVDRESKEDTLRALSSVKARDVVAKLSRRMDAMSLTMDPQYAPFYRHLVHHAVWDAVGKTETTHEDVMESMLMASNRVEPVYTHEVVDPRDGNKVMGRYQSVEAARRGRDRFDNKYGAYRYKVRKIETGEVRFSNRIADIGDALQARVDNNFDELVAEYNQLKGTKGGRLLDTDIARELSPEYRQDRSRAAEVHEAASSFIQRLYEQRVQAAEPGGVVAFMAGGGGAGKSSAEYLLADKLDEAHTILDGTLSSLDKSRRNVRMALDAGQGAVIAYVYRDPVDAMRNGVLTRAMRTGRVVPVDALTKGHAGSSTVVRRLQAELGGNRDFKVYAVDNSKGAGKAEIVPLESITPVIIDGLKERLTNATEEEFRDGKISETIYRATVGSQADAGAAPQAGPEDAADRQGDSRDLQGRRGPVEEGNTVASSNRRQRLRGSNFDLPATGNIDAARIRLQDDALRMKRVIEAVKEKGGTVGEAQNFYDANTLMPGRIQAAIDDFKTDVIKPMLDQAAEYGIDMDELSMYAYAKHAKERNAYIASINRRMPDGGSGMTNDEADNILQMVNLAGDTAKFEDLHRRLMSITANTRQVMLSEGLITQDEFDAMTNAYQDYIPLRGFENVDEETGAMRPGIGRGVNIRGVETIRAMGRKSKAGDLIENVIRDYERVVNRVEKNDVGKVLLDFVLSNPDPDLWGVDVERSKPAFNKATGTVQYTKSIDKGEDTIGVKVGGQQVYIKLADKELTRALRQAWKDETSGLERATLFWTGWWNNWMRAVLTKYNPAFALINIPRDALWSGTASALAELGPKGLARYLAAYPKAFMASARREAGVSGTSNALFGNQQVDARFAEFRASGGITGGFFMRSLDDINQDLRNELLLSGAAARNPWEKVKSLPPFRLATLTLKMLEFMGAASENATRFALYQAARESGRSQAQSAILAKDGTTNFNRKGEWGGALNNLYLFFNAAVQGNAQLFKVLKSPAVVGSMAGVTGIGMMLALYGASAGGEDDDGEAYWDKIPSYIKERNIVIMLPPGDALAGGIERVGKRGRYITIPVQYGFNMFPNLGYVMADVLRNQQDPKRGLTPTKAALHMTSTVFGSVNPFGGAVDLSDGVQVLLAAMPTLADLPIQLINERGPYGSPSSPQKSSKAVPDSERMFISQQDSMSAKIAKTLNELGGGNEAKAGKIMGIETSVTPGTIQTLIGATTGGLGTFVEQVGTAVIAMTGDDKSLKANKIPFLNKFYGEVDEGANIKTAGDRMREVRKLSEEVKAQQQDGIDPKLTDEEERLLKLAGMQQVYQRQSTMMRKAELAIIEDKKMTEAEKKLERKRLQVERDKLATEMNREYLKTVPK